MAETDDDLAEAEPTDLETPGLGPLPRFPTLGLRRPTPAPDLPAPGPLATPEPALSAPPAPHPDLAGPPSGPGSGASSRASTSPPVDLKDLQAAIREATDMAFVNIGQGLGWMEKRAKGLPEVDPKWIPTKTERALVSEPAARIARRHMHADTTALDTIDGLMIAVGVGGFVTKRAFNIDPLEEPQP